LQELKQVYLESFLRNIIYINKRNEWEPETLKELFYVFKTTFNSVFCKFFNNSKNGVLTIIVRRFVEIFMNYYMEELIHTIRNVFKKKAYISDFHLINYELKHLKCPELADRRGTLDQDDSFIDERKDSGDSGVFIGKIKDLDEIEDRKRSESKHHQKRKKSHKYFTVDYKFVRKKLNPESKRIDYKSFINKLNVDADSFINFLETFDESSKDPFSKIYPCVFGKFFIESSLTKFKSIIEVLKCKKSELNDVIPTVYKESFSGELGRVLLEALLCIREDHKEIIKSEKEKKAYIMLYENQL